MNAAANYFAELNERIGTAWNRFWFLPSDAFPLGVLRILSGCMALYFLLSQTADLVRWFGPDGLLSAETVQRFTGAADFGGFDQPQAVYRFSYLYYIDEPLVLWIVHLLGLLVVASFTAGFFTRVTSVLSLIVVLSYIHRAPMITGQFEPVLTMVLFYLCLGPAGRCLSIDRFLRDRKSDPALSRAAADDTNDESWLATTSLRLIQVHVTALYVLIVLTQLGGQFDAPYAATWWRGEAVWWLIARTESRLVDLTFLHRVPYLFNAWTHAIVLFELSFPVLIWIRWLRPLMLGLAVLMWSGLALITGLVSYCLLMLLLGAAFLPAEWLRGMCQACCPRLVGGGACKTEATG